MAVELAGMPVPLTPAERTAVAAVRRRRPRQRDATAATVSRRAYTLNGDRITFGPMIATRMACPGTESVGAAGSRRR